MSVKQIALVFSDENIKSTKKLILVAMADYCGDDGICYPRLETLAAKCSLSRSAIVSHLKELEESGYIIKVARPKIGGGRYSNKYMIYPSYNKANMDEKDYEEFFPKVQNSESPDSGPSESPDFGLSLLSTETSLIETSLNITGCGKNDLSLGFEEAWTAYGRKGAKQPSLKRWKQEKCCNHVGEIGKAITAYLQSKRVADGYKRDFQTWIKDRLWETDWEKEKDPQIALREADMYEKPF